MATSVASPTTVVKRTWTPSDSGAVIALRVGANVLVVVPDPLTPDLTVEGTAVGLVAVVNIDASGYREWEVRGLAPGRSVVRGTRPVPFTLTFDVSA